MVLSFFLWIGTIILCAFNQSQGGVPECIDFWNMIVNMGTIVAAISIRILAGMLPGPLLTSLLGIYLVLILLVFFNAPHCNSDRAYLWGSVLVRKLWMFVRFSLVNTDWNYFERISALNLLSV